MTDFASALGWFDTQMYSETYALLLALGKDYIERLPSDVFEFIKSQSDPMYMPTIDQNKGFHEQGLNEETISVFAMLRLNYLCDSEEEKTSFTNYLQANDQKLKQLLMTIKSIRELLRLVKEN